MPDLKVNGHCCVCSSPINGLKCILVLVSHLRVNVLAHVVKVNLLNVR